MNNELGNIILIGMPTSGKSTFGKRLAAYQKSTFVDTDAVLEAQAKQAIQSIVDVRGPFALRRIEERAVLSLDLSNAVIATGGSVVYSDIAMRYLQSIGRIVYLKISRREMLRRIRCAPLRGLAKPKNETISQLYCKRYKLYEKWADLTLENSFPLTDARFDAYVHCINSQAELAL